MIFRLKNFKIFKLFFFSNLGMFDLWPVMGKCTVVAKRQILYVQPFGLAAYLAGLVFIDRHITRARTKLDAAAEYIKTKKIKLWVFPEGIVFHGFFQLTYFLKKTFFFVYFIRHKKKYW